MCEYKQCPLQCPDGKGGFERFNSIIKNDSNLEYLDRNTDCIGAIVEAFARDNVLFTDYFVQGWIKVILNFIFKTATKLSFKTSILEYFLTKVLCKCVTTTFC